MMVAMFLQINRGKWKIIRSMTEQIIMVIKVEPKLNPANSSYLSEVVLFFFFFFFFYYLFIFLIFWRNVETYFRR